MILIVLNSIQKMSKGPMVKDKVLHSCKSVTESYPRSRSKRKLISQGPESSLLKKTMNQKPKIFRFCSSTVFQGVFILMPNHELSTHLHPHCAPPAPEDQLEMHPSWVFGVGSECHQAARFSTKKLRVKASLGF